MNNSIHFSPTMHVIAVGFTGWMGRQNTDLSWDIISLHLLQPKAQKITPNDSKCIAN